MCQLLNIQCTSTKNTKKYAGSSSEEKIKVGEELLGYASELGKIQELLESAYASVLQCYINILEEDTYQGEAAEEMQAFFMSLEANVNKMILLYQAAVMYVTNVYTEMYYNDEQLAAWAVKELQGE